MKLFGEVGRPKAYLLLMICAVLFSNHIQAQNAIASPYSRYGIGEITGKGFAQNFAMGGTNIALQSGNIPYFFVNNGNPASYANMRWTTADLGINFNHLQLSSASQKSSVNTASIGYAALAIPLKKWCGAL